MITIKYHTTLPNRRNKLRKRALIALSGQQGGYMLEPLSALAG